ncbi:hypothetical protein HZU77_010365 [Neisseriaceae bacterium TC5R-5]|nr:hypothetical protein [Neisseriaceae bacterium TC5R-5]
MNLLRCCLLGFSLTAAVVQANELNLPFVGQAGELPLEVVMRFAKPRLGQDGKFAYQTLRVLQHSQPEAFDRANISLSYEGLMDDSIKGVRLQLRLSRDGSVWTINSVREDFSCRRGRNGWSVKPCP